MTAVTTRLPGVSLRPARSSDVSQILRFIRELADFERLSHEVVATEKTLQATLFGENPVAEVILAEDKGEAVGFALFFRTYSTFLARPGLYLEDLYIEPAARGRGIGTALLAYLARIALERGYGRLEWSVLDWNKDALKVYRAVGAIGLNDWTVQRVVGDALLALARRFDNEFDG
jgi:GNAT superfamily N-acetyltransferase